MVYPVFAANSDWFKSENKRNYFTKITILDKYTPPEGVPSWNAAADGSDPINCYEVGTELVIVGNGSKRICTNQYASKMFGRIVATDDYFENVEAIEGLDILDTSNTTDMSMMFQACHKVKELDLRSFDTSKVTTFQGMFSSKKSDTDMQLTNILGIEDFDVSALTSLYVMFGRCASLKFLDLSRWTVSSDCKDMRQVFVRCKSLEMISGISEWPVSTDTDVRSMFEKCHHLRELDLSKWELGAAAKTDGLLINTYGLEKIAVGHSFNASDTVLGNPTSSYIEGADGKWHTIHGDSFTAATMPSGVNLTYYATEAAAQEDLAKLKQSFVLVDGYTAVGIADAIRDVTGTYGDLKPNEWASALRSLMEVTT